MSAHVSLHVGLLREASATQVAAVGVLDIVRLVGPLMHLAA